MINVIQPLQFLAIALACWLNRQQQTVIDYLIEENRVLKDQLEGVYGELLIKPQLTAGIVRDNESAIEVGEGQRG